MAFDGNAGEMDGRFLKHVVGEMWRIPPDEAWQKPLALVREALFFRSARNEGQRARQQFEKDRNKNYHSG